MKALLASLILFFAVANTTALKAITNSVAGKRYIAGSLGFVNYGGSELKGHGFSAMFNLPLLRHLDMATTVFHEKTTADVVNVNSLSITGLSLDLSYYLPVYKGIAPFLTGSTSQLNSVVRETSSEQGRRSRTLYISSLGFGAEYSIDNDNRIRAAYAQKYVKTVAYQAFSVSILSQLSGQQVLELSADFDNDSNTAFNASLLHPF